MVQDMGGVDQALYNINANGQAVNVLGDSQDFSNENNQHQQIYYQDGNAQNDDGTKVAAIAQKIRELTESAHNPAERDRALSEWKVKFNNQIMTLKEFLALCGQEPMEV